MLLFVPTTCYATSTADAETITSLDLGYVKGLASRTVSLRVANSADSPAISLSVRDAPPDHEFIIEPSAFTLEPDAISDTVSITLSLPLGVESAAHVVNLDATTDSGETFTLPLTYESVGANTDRTPQYPRRAGQATDIATGPILALGDSLVLHRYDPLPCAASGVVVVAGSRDLDGDASGTRFVSACDPCQRLDPNNQIFGYVHDAETVIGRFQREQRSTTTHLLADSTTLTYHVAASLILPAAVELVREWALFSPTSGADKPQYKRTVWLVQRAGEFYAVENVRSLDFAEDLSHFEADLVAVHDRTTGSPDYYNPFAITYEYQSDKPYAAYACDLDPIALMASYEDPYAA